MTDKLQEYAQLLINVGLNVQKDQYVVISSQVDCAYFARMCIAAAYEAGAKQVIMNWNDDFATRQYYLNAADEVFDQVFPWEAERPIGLLKKGACFLTIAARDPENLKGVDPERIARANIASGKANEEFSIEMMNSAVQWCIASMPVPSWAKKVFPDLSKSRAVEKLWEAILSCSRALEGDPQENWRQHNLELKSRAEALNAMGLVALEYSSANGTDLRVGLIPEALFLGGAERCPVNGVMYDPNIPSEELFITPRAGEAEGIVYATRPLAFQGVLIEDFWLRFAGGRVVELHAEKNEDALRTLVEMDEGSAMLGECALVPYMSPIRESGILFYNTLFDENAACHLALGRGYSSNIRDYEKYSLDELRAMGVNDSMVHEDFMIGSADLAVTGVTASGERIPIFRDGGWAF